MAGEISPVSRRLKEIRRRAGLSIREVADQLGMEHGSSYQHYEDRYRKPYMPLDFVRRLIPIFETGGVGATDVYALAGVDAAQRPLGDEAMLHIEELDVRAGAGAGLVGSN